MKVKKAKKRSTVAASWARLGARRDRTKVKDQDSLEKGKGREAKPRGAETAKDDKRGQEQARVLGGNPVSLNETRSEGGRKGRRKFLDRVLLQLWNECRECARRAQSRGAGRN